MNSKKIKRLKFACYTSSMSMSVVACLSPILFLTFRSMYGISFSLLGLLVLINFVTQLGIDLIFSFFSHKFNIPKTVKSMPIITVVGLFVYAILPWLMPGNEYFAIALGTVIFSAAAGLGEVLISPTFAAIPSDDPEREMSKLHSAYAWGVVGVTIVCTLFLFVFGKENWQILAMLLSVIPLTSAYLYAGAEVPKMETPEKISGAAKLLKNKGLWLSVGAIFLGGASECTMAQWSSSYLEQTLNIPKVWGDIFGVALFSFMLGLGRTLYSKFGKNICRVLLWSGIGATVCYLTAAVSANAVLGLFACIMTGFCTAMLWPGNLIVATDRFPAGGVFVYALMAAGGDLGASVVPQLVGVITDFAISNPQLAQLGANLGLTPEDAGMKLGMLVATIFPVISIPVYGALKKQSK
ncbi:MAG: MFS transporter [Ruminococcaceae bacterium]|nr:MFS transporter [Oscillospiraceae bacterium]